MVWNLVVDALEMACFKRNPASRQGYFFIVIAAANTPAIT
jgi:hypothetical protein